MKIKIFALLVCLALLLTGCNAGKDTGDVGGDGSAESQLETQKAGNSQGTVGYPPDKDKNPNNNYIPGGTSDIVGDEQSYGEDIEQTGAYDGYFEGDAAELVIECISGTADAYTLEGSTLTFRAIEEDSVYSISGGLKGAIVIDVGDACKFTLELHGLSLVSELVNPITVKSGDEITIKAKKDTQNYIYDMRAAIDGEDETLYSGAIRSEVDLTVGGKGELFVISENNNGIHSKKDLSVKNLTLFVFCADNALKGNDSVEIESGSTTLIASLGDCIKTKSSDISEKGNQRGSVSITGGTHTLYAACDGIDAAYNATVDGEDTVLNIYTDKYSNYSGEVTATASDESYIRFSSNKYYYSVKYYNSDTDFVWVNAEYHSQVSGGRSKYYYYSYPKMPEYAKLQFFVYESEDQLGQNEEYAVASEYLTQNSDYDTFALSNRNGQVSYNWTNYTTNVQEGGRPGGGGPGGGGNTEKGDHSTKGIKAANEIVINGGAITVKSYDDALHANNDGSLENGETPLGNLSVNGGELCVYSNDDGLHADGILTVTGGIVSVTGSYEGLEGANVRILGGSVSVIARDDGLNATASSGEAITIGGGTVYIYCTGDGIDSNSRTSYQGIVFSGGRTVVIANSNGNSAIDSDSGYSCTGGSVLAVMNRGGMSGEATHCQDFSSIGSSTQLSLKSGDLLVASIGEATVTVQMPTSVSALVIALGSSSASVTTASTTAETLDGNGVAWN